jgi:hypothetical protein
LLVVQQLHNNSASRVTIATRITIAALVDPNPRLSRIATLTVMTLHGQVYGSELILSLPTHLTNVDGTVTGLKLNLAVCHNDVLRFSVNRNHTGG